MRHLVIFLLAATSVWGGDQTGQFASSAEGSVATWTNDFLSSLRAGRFDLMAKFFTADSTIEAKTKELPFGGTYVGTDIQQFFKKLDLTATYANSEYRLIAVDEAKGLAIVESSRLTTFRRSGGQVLARCGGVIQWNVVTGTIIRITMAAVNESEILASYYTRAERLYWNLVNAVWKRETFTLDLNDPLWNLIADDVYFQLHMHPSDFFSTNEVHGKAGVLRWFLDAMSKFPRIKHHKQLVGMLIRRSIEHHVLFADDESIMIHFKFGRFEGAKKITFNSAGQLSRCEELLFPLYPWDLYKMPTLPETGMSKETSNLGGMTAQGEVVQQQQAPILKPVLTPVETVGIKAVLATEAPVLPIQSKTKTMPIETRAPEPVKATEAPQPIQQGKVETKQETAAPVQNVQLTQGKKGTR